MNIISSNANAADKIITSIRPIQSIIANLTKNINHDLEVMIVRNESLHNFHLRPSTISAIHKSDTIFIIDRNFEVFFQKIMPSLKKNQNIIELARLPNIKLLVDEGGHHHCHDHEDHEHVAEENYISYDYHLWLDIELVKKLSAEITKKLISFNPNFKKQYQDNLANFITKLDQLDLKIKVKMKGLEKYNFVVTHNAYQYFINRYGLKTPKAITIDHDYNIGASDILEIQKSIDSNQVKCIFKEPQFESQVIENLKKNSTVKIAQLDAEGGPNNCKIEDLYEVLIEDIANSFYQCLAD